MYIAFLSRILAKIADTSRNLGVNSVQMELELRDYVRIVRKHIWKLISIVLISTVVAGVYSFYFVEPTYEASTKIIVNRTATQTSVTTLDLNEINSNLRLIDTYKEIIRTPAIMDVVAERYPQFGMTAEELTNKVVVSSVNNTQVMTLVVQDLSYQKAAQIVNAISEVFKEQIPSIFQVENVSILNLANENPEKQPAPVKPNKMLNMALAFIVSLMLSVGIAFLIEYMDDTIKNEADVKRLLDLPTVGQIARLSAEELQSGQEKEKKPQQLRGEMKSNVQIGK
ncbi:capsular polysaccharide biosynthesis protein [Paenibacillus phyllosphaerae]|uniref:Capsular polysaccharide biosynthesis protein n=1 Tax=Paenibacillus phyllosphaerae TaxID=274593 RepID=A0A7W5AXK8_9BACL|nr:Wzz/FepE/Etk N-terminal domain-containing protein [Paenibacillus phyllosphaerae]MBB3110572.1 capsular polysaccharide biosynthesis protein [Paenibacillus phyllosphaerae]